MTKIVPNDLINPTEKTIKNWNCSFIAVEGPNVLDKMSLEDLEIPYESQYRARIILKAGETDQPLNYGFIGKAVTFLMIKVTYDSVNDPYYQYEQEKYNISYYFDNDPVLKSLGRLLIMTGSAEVKIPQIYLNNPLDYDVVLDVMHATIDLDYSSGNTYGGFGMLDLDDVILSGLTSGDTLMYFDGFWHNVPYTYSGGTGGFGTSGTSGKDGLSGSSGTNGTSGTSGSITGATVHIPFYYLSGTSTLYVPHIVASGLTLTGLTISGLTNYIVSDSIGRLYISSASDRIHIPQLKLDTGFYTVDSENKITDTLRCYWESVDTNFLNYNPEVWVFRRKNYTRNPNSVKWKMRHIKWTHEPHLNGIKFSGSSYYSGTISCIVPEIKNTGRNTEFTLTTTGSSYKMIVPLNPYDYIYGSSGGTWIKLSDSTNFGDLDKIKVTGRRDSLSLPLRFAIAIDNPDINTANPKIIGDMSDIVYLRYGSNGGNGNIIRYFWNEIDVKMFGTGRWI